MFSRTAAQIAASVLLHAGVAGLVLVFSSGGMDRDEQVYRVTLAEFAAPAASSPAASSPSPSVQPDMPKPEPAQPEPQVKKPPKPKTKKLRAKNTPQKPKPEQEEQPTAPPAPTRTAPAGPGDSAGSAGAGESTGPPGSGGPSLNIGGLAAYGIDAVDQRPSIARRVVPEYPAKARRMNVEGKVLVHLVVDTAGKPRECTVYQAEPAGYFEDAALAAARKTRFIPGRVRGRPVNTAVLIPFIFILR